jgi:hexosaminidase
LKKRTIKEIAMQNFCVQYFTRSISLVVIGLLLLSLGNVCQAAEGSDLLTGLIPKPMKIEKRSGQFEFGPNVSIKSTDAETGSYLREMLRPVLDTKDDDPKNGPSKKIILKTDPKLTRLGTEGYLIDITEQEVRIEATTAAGLFYGCQTLRQLLPVEIESSEGCSTRWTLPCCHIEDQPRFSWRGVMLDNSRHFVTPELVKTILDRMAFYKLNLLHWHLSDDQGWRVEIDRYPNLTEVGAWRTNLTARKNMMPTEKPGRYGGYFTKEQIREIVDYARKRHITIVPEIELPGHCMAMVRSYPELTCRGKVEPSGNSWRYHDVLCIGEEKVFEFVDNVLDELIELFPSPWIHIGGDECTLKRWKKCPKCQTLMKAEGFEDEWQLQDYFTRRVGEMIQKKGRRMIGWDEIAEREIAPGATVQSWRSMEVANRATETGHDTVISITAHYYFDYTYKKTSVEKTYQFDPTLGAIPVDQQDHVLGIEGCLWLGNVSSKFYEKHGRPLDLAGIDYQLFPRAIALAEAAWTAGPQRDWDDFRRRLRNHEPRLDALGISFGRCESVWAGEPKQENSN